MPITPIHLTFNLTIYSLIVVFTPLKFSYMHVLFLAMAELIDLDHLSKKQIYIKTRNSFKHHFFHKNWKITSVVALALIAFPPLSFLGLGILSHFLLDYIHLKVFIEKPVK
jgi:hypothetical protein